MRQRKQRAMKGHQPFFLGAALFAILAVGAWAAMLAGALPLGGDPALWHAHEMLFGYTVGVLAGFLLIGTSGWRLGVLATLWAAGRIVLAAGAPAGLAAPVDLAFAPALALLRLPPLWSGRKWPTIGFVPLLAALFAGNLSWHLDRLGLLPGAAARGEGLALDLYTLMIAVMAGRLVPGYTRAMLIPLRRPKDPAREAWSAALGIGLLAADQFGWLMLAGGFALALAGLQALRLAGWRTRAALRHPLVIVLHLGFAWFVLGLAPRGTAALIGWPAPAEALHALTVGAVGTLTLGMMGRLVRTHARQPLTASRLDLLSYALLSAAALARAVLPAAVPAVRSAALVGAGLLWVLAFALFLAGHGRTLSAGLLALHQRRRAAGPL